MTEASRMVIQLEENAAVQLPDDDTRVLIHELDKTPQQVETDEQRRLVAYPKKSCEWGLVWRIWVDERKYCK
jgi:hypothetical protein